MTVVTISTEDLARMIQDIVHDELEPIKKKVLHVPDETIISDDEAARIKGVSVSTIRRWKAKGKINSIPTSHGRVCRVCDVEK